MKCLLAFKMKIYTESDYEAHNSWVHVDAHVTNNVASIFSHDWAVGVWAGNEGWSIWLLVDNDTPPKKVKIKSVDLNNRKITFYSNEEAQP